MQTETVLDDPYIVRSGSFEGPLEYLLTLVESRKLFINEISLAQVTNDYLAHVRSLPKYGMNDLTGFIVVAATLILIKSRSLLPNLELTTEEEENIADLETRLALYQKAKDLGETLKAMYGKQRILLGARHLGSDPIWSPDQRITRDLIHTLALELLRKAPVEEIEIKPEVTLKKVMSIDEMIEDLTNRITKSISMSFKEFSRNPEAEDDKEQKVHTIISFLALLELVREGIIDALQSNVFEDITISKITNETTV